MNQELNINQSIEPFTNEIEKVNGEQNELVQEAEKINILSNPTTLAVGRWVTVKNLSWTVSQYALINVNTNIKQYESGHHEHNDTWSLDLSVLGLPNGTQFYLKAEVEAGSDSTADRIIQYKEDSVYSWVFVLTGTAFDTSLKYSYYDVE